ncbi:MAG: hypothetical protein ACJAYU_004214 [Bradymonadia bacterium]|jgi:hypothetical protein
MDADPGDTEPFMAREPGDEQDEEVRDPRKPRFIAVPVIGYTPDTNVGFAGIGMVQFRPRSCQPTNRTSTVAFAASYTLRQQWLLGADPKVYLNDGRIFIDGRALVQDWHSDYFGVGPDAPLSAEEEYVPRQVILRGVFNHVVGDPRVYAGIGYHLEYDLMREIQSGGLLDTGRPTGVDGGISTGPLLSVSWDDRDNSFFPHRGTFVTGSLQLSNDAFGADFDYIFGSVDARGYIDLGTRGRHILAGRVNLEFTAGDPPFFGLPSLGGSSLMRGMTAGRLRDSNAISGQLEYRTPLVGRFGFATFAAIGEVFGEFAALQASPRWTAGAGVRFRADRHNRVNIRLDYGVSREEITGFYFSVTEAF